MADNITKETIEREERISSLERELGMPVDRNLEIARLTRRAQWYALHGNAVNADTALKALQHALLFAE